MKQIKKIYTLRNEMHSIKKFAIYLMMSITSENTCFIQGHFTYEVTNEQKILHQKKYY